MLFSKEYYLCVMILLLILSLVSCYYHNNILNKKILHLKQQKMTLIMMVDNKYEMDYIQLGSSDLKVSKICLGTMTFGEQNTLEEGVQQLSTSFNEYGINFIDTGTIL